jgi:hypothetical protein
VVVGVVVGRTPRSAADAPVGLFAPCIMPISLLRMRDEGARPQRGPQKQGTRPTNSAEIRGYVKTKWHWAEACGPNPGS